MRQIRILQMIEKSALILSSVLDRELPNPVFLKCEYTFKTFIQMFSVIAIWLGFKAVNNGGVKLKYLYFDNNYATMPFLQRSMEDVHVRVQASTVQLNAS